jgi:hypothetical protein
MTAVGEAIVLTAPMLASRETVTGWYDDDGDVTLLAGTPLILLEGIKPDYGSLYYWVVVEDEAGRRWWIDGDTFYDQDG